MVTTGNEIATINPIFVAGPDRSGTSLIYAILSSHPDISMVRRTNMFRYFYGQYGDLANEDNFERCLNTMLSYKRLVHLHPDPQRIRREFRQGEPTYGRLFALFHAHNAERIGKTRWGDKSLHTECFADNVFTAFPNARILHMVRDPRDRYASVLKRYATNRGMVGKATGKWLYSVVYGFHNVEKFPNKYMLVKYEELTLEPDKMVRKICDFLEVDFMPEMLSMSGAPDHNERGGNSSFQRFNPGEISTSPVGRYRKVLTQQDIAFMQAYSGRYMSELGYEIDTTIAPWYRWPAQQIIQYPINLVRMTGWTASEYLKRKRGEKLPAYRIIKPSSSPVTENPPEKNMI